jgi:hypothetical protein
LDAENVFPDTASEEATTVKANAGRRSRPSLRFSSQIVSLIGRCMGFVQSDFLDPCFENDNNLRGILFSWWTLWALMRAIRVVPTDIGGLNPATIGIMVARLDGYRSVKLEQVELS